MKREMPFSICLRTLTVLIVLLAIQHASAQSTASATPVVAPSISASRDAGGLERKDWALTVSVSSETNLEDGASTSDETFTTLEVLPAYRISSKAKVQALLGAERDHNGLQNTRMLNTTVSIVRDPIRINDDTDLGLTAQAVLPTDEDARELSGLRGGGGAIAKITHNFRLFNHRAVTSYALNGLKYSHEFTRNADRSANVSYRARHTGTLDVTLNKHFDLGIGGYYQTGWTYDNVVREAYQLEQSISYNVKKNVAVALSHSTGGDLFEKDGREWRANFYDDRTSSVGVNLTAVY